jgi:NitT/TauT family transport system permease protein
MSKYLWPIAPLLAVLVLWELVSRSGIVSTALFPPPSQVMQSLGELVRSGTLLFDIKASLWRVLAGLVLGTLFGVVLGLLTGRMKSWAAALSPIIQVLRPLPAVAIIPLVIVWLGIGDGAKIFSISFAVFFPVWINAHIGAERVPRAFLWSAQLLTQSFFKKLFKVILPAALPFIIAGVRVGIAVAFIMVFVSELAGASVGVGYRISVSHLAYRIDDMMAALIVLGALGAFVDQLFVYFTRRIFPWVKLSTS